jgi:hypothetical protein
MSAGSRSNLGDYLIMAGVITLTADRGRLLPWRHLRRRSPDSAGTAGTAPAAERPGRTPPYGTLTSRCRTRCRCSPVACGPGTACSGRWMRPGRKASRRCPKNWGGSSTRPGSAGTSAKRWQTWPNGPAARISSPPRKPSRSTGRWAETWRKCWTTWAHRPRPQPGARPDPRPQRRGPDVGRCPHGTAGGDVHRADAVQRDVLPCLHRHPAGLHHDRRGSRTAHRRGFWLSRIVKPRF